MGSVCTLNVTLQLEWCGILTVTMLAGSVVFPALTVLLLKFQMVLHVVHKPVSDCQQVQIFRFIIKGKNLLNKDLNLNGKNAVVVLKIISPKS